MSTHSSQKLFMIPKFLRKGSKFFSLYYTLQEHWINWLFHGKTWFDASFSCSRNPLSLELPFVQSLLMELVKFLVILQLPNQIPPLLSDFF